MASKSKTKTSKAKSSTTGGPLNPPIPSSGGGPKGAGPNYGGQGGTGGNNDDGGGCCDIPAFSNPLDYYPDQLILYGIKLSVDNTRDKNDKNLTRLPFGDKVLYLQVYSKEPFEALPMDVVSIAAVYGYSYEGHCYRLDKPRLFAIDKGGSEAKGCGFTKPYFMWKIRKLTSLMEIALNYDLAESLILEDNLPGNRSPNTYGNHMQLAHRNGKLNRSGGV